MKLILQREYDNGKDTIGRLYFKDKSEKIIYLYTLEDTYRKEKIAGETRIPSGTYNISLVKEGRIYESYCKHSDPNIRMFTLKYGVIQIDDVPNYEGIRIHIGNFRWDTKGCPLVGMQVNNNSIMDGQILDSIKAYNYLTYALEDAIIKKDSIIITIIDDHLDRIENTLWEKRI